MPLYFFDVENQDILSEDDVGIECQSRNELRNIAIKALTEIANSAFPDGDHHIITVTVRDETGKPIFRASLRLDAGWLDES